MRFFGILLSLGIFSAEAIAISRDSHHRWDVVKESVDELITELDRADPLTRDETERKLRMMGRIYNLLVPLSLQDTNSDKSGFPLQARERIIKDNELFSIYRESSLYKNADEDFLNKFRALISQFNMQDVINNNEIQRELVQFLGVDAETVVKILTKATYLHDVVQGTLIYRLYHPRKRQRQFTENILTAHAHQLSLSSQLALVTALSHTHTAGISAINILKAVPTYFRATQTALQVSLLDPALGPLVQGLLLEKKQPPFSSVLEATLVRQVFIPNQNSSPTHSTFLKAYIQKYGTLSIKAQMVLVQTATELELFPTRTADKKMNEIQSVIMELVQKRAFSEEALKELRTVIAEIRIAEVEWADEIFELMERQKPKPQTPNREDKKASCQRVFRT